jgi:propanol-preferring alcohol dehydrogenase
MRAMQLAKPGEPLRAVELPDPEPAAGQVRVRVTACAVCRTDLHVVDGDLTEGVLPIIPGHEIVGRIDRVGEGVEDLAPGTRVGIPWLGSTCGRCSYCASGRENLCDEAAFTGYQIDGGYAEYAVADARYAFVLPEEMDDVAVAPLLCAGLIGHRCLRMAGGELGGYGRGRLGGGAERLGLYGFGAAAHIVTQVARHEGRRVFAFTRRGDEDAQRFALDLGAQWAGDSQTLPPEPLDAAILFAPVGALVPAALRAVVKGGVVVCGGIHMSDIPAFPYSILWGERVVRSVANLTRRDAEEFLALAPRVPVRTETVRFPLAEANEALRQLRDGELRGAAVLIPD